MKKIYQESGDDELCPILENKELDEELAQESYDFGGLMIKNYINIPEDWE